MSSGGRESWPAFRSDGRLAFVSSDNRGRIGSKAVGKPDKTPLFDLVRKHVWAPGTFMRTLQSLLQTALLRLNCLFILKLLPTPRFCRMRKWCISKNLPRPGPHSSFDWTRPRPTPVLACLPTAARAPSYYAQR